MTKQSDKELYWTTRTYTGLLKPIRDYVKLYELQRQNRTT